MLVVVCPRPPSVSQYSDENMMQPYNLAVCFGPSLLRGLDADDAVARQPQVNDLVKSMILQHDIIFPGQSELPGPVYEKHMTLEQEYWWEVVIGIQHILLLIKVFPCIIDRGTTGWSLWTDIVWRNHLTSCLLAFHKKTITTWASNCYRVLYCSSWYVRVKNVFLFFEVCSSWYILKELHEIFGFRKNSCHSA